MNEVKKTNINDVLTAIDKIQDKNLYSVFIPSLQKNVMFKEMSTKQEKMIIKTIVDNPIYNSEFIFAMREIIRENCAEELDIDSLTLIDKTAICLVMRQKSIGDEFEFTFKDTDKTTKIKISDYIDDFKKIKIPEDREVGNGGITVVCGYPTIKTEFDLEKEFRSNVNDMEFKTYGDARDALGEVFTNELVKYIKKIVIKDDESESVLNMEDYNFKNRIQILERFGNIITQEILNYIEESNDAVREALTVKVNLDEDEQKKYDKKVLTSILETGSDFFIIS